MLNIIDCDTAILDFPSDTDQRMKHGIQKSQEINEKDMTQYLQIWSLV